MTSPASPKIATHDIVAKLWNLCNILKDGGVTYHEYVIELTYLLFLKMAQETGVESKLPKQYRWNSLVKANKDQQLDAYRTLLTHIGYSSKSSLVKEIFAEADTSIRRPAIFSRLLEEMEKLEWYRAHKEDIGDLYEGLLEKNANEKKSGAGQYFTPRPLIDCMVDVMQPSLADVIQDPAAGTGGFIVSANRFILARENPAAWTKAQKEKYRYGTFYGMEFVHDTHRMALMNLMLHGLEYDPARTGIWYGDTLGKDAARLPQASLILSNPPFGSKKGGGPPEREFGFPTNNKQLAFLQHIYHGLQPGGRAAVVMPDNVLFEANIGRSVRAELMNKCNLHTILRLPTGIFYAQGVKTNVLFFTRGLTDKDNTREVWVYDMRADMPNFGKKTLLTEETFKDFKAAFGSDPRGGEAGLGQRSDTGESGRFRRFSRQTIAERGDNLDIAWLKDENADADLPEPEVVVQRAILELEAALETLRSMLAELQGGVGK